MLDDSAAGEEFLVRRRGEEEEDVSLVKEWVSEGVSDRAGGLYIGGL